MVGIRLSQLLSENGYEVSHLSRKVSNGPYKTYLWDYKGGYIEREAITKADAIIHLAGAGVADKRWSDKRKEEIYDSRIGSTKFLFDKVAKLNPELKYFLSASAIGIYGWDTGDTWVEESTPKGDGFLADVVADWEKEVESFRMTNISSGIVRIGVVLSDSGGALQEIARPIKLGFGAPLASGKQFLSWIHIDDLCKIFIHCLDQKVNDTLNGVAPTPVTNQELTKMIAKRLGRTLFLPNVPKFALKLVVGEMADMIIGGNRVSSKKIQQFGYEFQFPDLNTALEDIMKNGRK